MGRKTKAEAAETRERILEAAERIFFENGVMRTTLEQIAKEAGVTRGAIYWHFSNKLELFQELHERVRLPQEEMFQRAIADRHPDPLQLMEETVYSCLDLLSKDEQRQRIYTILTCRCEYVGEMLYALERQRDVDEELLTDVKQAFHLAQEQGMLSPAWTPETASRVFVSFMSGLFSDWLRYGMNFEIVQTGRACLADLFRSFRRAPEAGDSSQSPVRD
ncbi:TetR family transcriptional regulator [Telmatospirillum sp. J64-1]|uniref:TetR family transcriptional regulator n=1 Tax=Telmatospirillum sp. J64-1 TaxID=2502183 RepID=UPI00115E7188|nr:TetR family transcriptional regulator [Telmatospirillum sp. J64-1]